jgi:hypothetical protein
MSDAGFAGETPSAAPSSSQPSPPSTWPSLPQKKRALILVLTGVSVLIAFFAITTVIGARALEGESVEAQVSHSGNPIERLVSESVDDLNVTKTRDSLRLRFTFNTARGQVCGVCQFSIGMADADGDMIDRFITDRVHNLWQDWREPRPQHVDLRYEVNPGIARRTRYVTLRVVYR